MFFSHLQSKWSERMRSSAPYDRSQGWFESRRQIPMKQGGYFLPLKMVNYFLDVRRGSARVGIHT